MDNNLTSGHLFPRQVWRLGLTTKGSEIRLSTTFKGRVFFCGHLIPYLTSDQDVILLDSLLSKCGIISRPVPIKYLLFVGKLLLHLYLAR